MTTNTPPENTPNIASNKSLPLRPCVGIMLLNQQNKVWIGRRISKSHDDPAALIWQMPQGGIDQDETPENAAIRELEEETGITRATIIQQSKEWYTYELPKNLWGKALKGKFRGQTQKWFAMKFEGTDEDIDIGEKLNQKAEFDQWKWESADKLPNLIIHFKRKVYEGVIEEFSSIIKG